MTTKELSEEIYKRYGAVTRARGYFLYTKKGVRLTDMFLEDGRAILGWQAGSAFTHMKNILSRGLTGSFRTEEAFRLKKALSTLLKKEVNFYTFSDKKSALTASLSFSKDNSAVWKAFNKDIDYSSFDAVILSPPLSWTNSVFLLAVDKTFARKSVKISSIFRVKSSFHLPLKLPLQEAFTTIWPRKKSGRKRTGLFTTPSSINILPEKAATLFQKFPGTNTMNLSFTVWINTSSLIPLLKGNPLCLTR